MTKLLNGASLVLAAATCWGAAAGAPVAQLQFPPSWGQPPEIQTADYTSLPGGYGYGSGSLGSWIKTHMEEDHKAGKIQFPPAFGEPPLRQTRDLVEWPFGYGRGSSTVARWLISKASEVYNVNKDRPPLGMMPTGVLPPIGMPPTLGGRVPPFAAKTPVKEMMNSGHHSAEAPKFPASWGPPPLRQTRDLVPLAGGYGHGSSTLSKWILAHIQTDSANGNMQYPPAFGPEPQMQTMDLGTLPFGYGMGSGTVSKWLRTKAQEVYQEDPSEYRAFHGDSKMNPWQGLFTI